MKRWTECSEFSFPSDYLKMISDFIIFFLKVLAFCWHLGNWFFFFQSRYHLSVNNQQISDPAVQFSATPNWKFLCDYWSCIVSIHYFTFSLNLVLIMFCYATFSVRPVCYSFILIYYVCIWADETVDSKLVKILTFSKHYGFLLMSIVVQISAYKSTFFIYFIINAFFFFLLIVTAKTLR